MEAIWEYVAGHSRVRPMVRKNSDRRLNTSESVVSSRLLYVVVSSRTSFSRVTEQSDVNVDRTARAQLWRTLFNYGLVELVDVRGFDILSTVTLECGESITDAATSGSVSAMQ